MATKEEGWDFLSKVISIMNTLPVEVQAAVLTAGKILLRNGAEYLHKSPDSLSSKKIPQHNATHGVTQSDRTV